MTELSKEESSGRSCSGRGFLKGRPFVLPDLAAQLIFWPLLAIGLALDLWSKSAVFGWLEPGESFPLIDGIVQFVRTENPGAAFGIAVGHPYLLIAVSVAALIVILVLFLFSGTKQKLVYAALALFAGGVCGNFYDRLANNGLVRDFIDVMYWPGRHWPAFNLADAMLCIGVGLLIVSTFQIPKRSS